MACHPAIPLSVFGWLCFSIGLAAAEPVPAPNAAELLAQLQSEDAEQVLTAAAALAQQPSAKAALPILVQRLSDDPSPQLRCAAARALAGIGIADPSLLEPLLGAIRNETSKSEDDAVRLEAGMTVGRLQFAGAAPAVLELLRSDRPTVRRAGAYAAHGLGAQAGEAVPALIELAQSPEADDRYAALSALMVIGPAAQDAVPVLIRQLDSDDFHTQYWACRVLGRIGAPASNPAVPRLIELTRSGVSSVRGNAAAALGEMGPQAGAEIIDPVIAALKDGSFTVRQRAAVALGKLGTFAHRAGPALEEAMKSSQFAAPSEAAAALILTTGKREEALRVLLEQLQQANSPMSAVQAFQQLGPQAEDAVPRLRKLLQADSAETRWCTVLALDAIGPAARAALADLDALADDEDEDVRDAAKQLAARLRS